MMPNCSFLFLRIEQERTSGTRVFLDVGKSDMSFPPKELENRQTSAVVSSETEVDVGEGSV